MLASFVVFLKPHHLAPLGRTVARSLHALLLQLISQARPGLGAELHAEMKVKPFTVSTLQGNFVRQRGRSYASPAETYWVRYTVLADAVFATLTHVLTGRQLYGDPVVIDGHPYDLVDIAVEPTRSHGWARLSSYKQLVEKAGPDPRVTLEFASPTTFRQGDVNLLFPLPVSVFGSYLRRWQALSPIALSDEGLLDFVEAQVVAERYELATEVVHYGDFQMNGFVGVCQYRVMSGHPDHVTTLNVLADFALFAGTGQKTTQGMGQTRRQGGASA